MRRITFLAFSIFAFLFTSVFWASAASEVKSSISPAVSPTPVVTKTPESEQQPSSKVSSSEATYSYSPLGKIDPFRPFVEDESAVKKQKIEKKEVVSIFPLQRLDLDKFRIVGIAGDQSRRIAIAEDATKKYYPLFIGTHIGLHNGKVMEILPDRVIVEEYETKKAKRIVLRLHLNQNEVKP